LKRLITEKFQASETKTNFFTSTWLKKIQFLDFFGTFNRPKTPKPVPPKIATLFLGQSKLFETTSYSVKMRLKQNRGKKE
jgi:hypothetical protein